MNANKTKQDVTKKAKGKKSMQLNRVLLYQITKTVYLTQPRNIGK